MGALTGMLIGCADGHGDAQAQAITKHIAKPHRRALGPALVRLALRR